MATVYIVTSGEYSDYGIEAVFLDKEKAEFFASIGDRMVEEWDTHDDAVDFQQRRIVRVVHAPGAHYPWGPWTCGRESVVSDMPEDWHGANHFYYIPAHQGRSKEEYIKAAQDRHAKWLAEQEGIA